MTFDLNQYPYPSKRQCVFAKNGMVATSQPLAAQAGLDILKKGGNAIDAAIATAACLTVVEPTSNGIGSDCFAVVWMQNALYGLNASGYAPKNISIDQLQALGYEKIPTHGMIPITIPGTPKGWVELSKRFGKLPLSDVLEPAIQYANEGFPLSQTLAYHWKQAYEIYKKNLTDPMFQPWFDTFAPHGAVPKVGDIWSSKDHAETLRCIAETNADAFYNGTLTKKIVDYSNKYGGFLSLEDFAEYDVDWVTPISINYKGYDVYELPPNGQGIIALMALSMLNNDQFTSRDNTETVHHQIEALKLAFADGFEYIADHKEMQVTDKHLLNAHYLKKRRDLISKDALDPMFGQPQKGGTVYLATADKDGNMVSYIQSNYMGFGSDILIPGTGIAMQNRGHNFSFDKHHVNALGPRKKPLHTIIPGFLMKDQLPIGPFGVMGGFMQPQGHLQVLMNMIDFNLNPQAALDAPRFQWMKDKNIIVEPSFPEHVLKDLILRGHHVTVEERISMFGRGQIIFRDKNGTYIGATEPRCDSMVAAW